ncbi:MAG: XrtA system polysaccharide deacetylase [Parvularculaceae bacterium]|nr:XrtA system polysaccharide deacetylase [Parvularculaceae bacterium]
MAAPARFAMSVDVEDYFQVWAFSGVIKRGDWDSYGLRAEDNTRRLLDLFDASNAKATFFTLGWVAERAPRLMRDIAARGHEVASHGYDHKKVFDQTPDEFRADLLKTKAILEDTSGAHVRGFRAAGFSIDGRSPWAHEILAETGHDYSSSSHPIAHDHYGDPNAPRGPHSIGGVIEAPVATAEVFGKRVSCAGGGWFRAAPYAVSKPLIDRASATISGPVIFYLHPWEVDPGQPRIAAAPLKSKLRHYVNLGAMEKKLARLLKAYDWTRIDRALGLA